jgi:hypothetical protein
MAALACSIFSNMGAKKGKLGLSSLSDSLTLNIDGQKL